MVSSLALPVRFNAAENAFFVGDLDEPVLNRGRFQGRVLPTVFEIDRRGNTLVITPDCNYHTLPDADFTDEVNRLVACIERDDTAVVVDLSQTTAYSIDKLLGALVLIWNRLSKQNGQLTLCGLNEQAREVFERTKLESLWQICHTLENAVQSLRERDRAT